MSSQVVYDRDAHRDSVTRAFKRVEGKVKTVIDAALVDPTQREAAKSLVEQHIWTEYDTFTEVLRNMEMKVVEAKAEKA